MRFNKRRRSQVKMIDEKYLCHVIWTVACARSLDEKDASYHRKLSRVTDANDLSRSGKTQRPRSRTSKWKCEKHSSLSPCVTSLHLSVEVSEDVTSWEEGNNVYNRKKCKIDSRQQTHLLFVVFARASTPSRRTLDCTKKNTVVAHCTHSKLTQSDNNL